MAKKKEVTLPKKNGELKPLTPKEIDKMIAESATVWRTRRPKEGKEKGIPRRPGEVRAFRHDF